MSPLQKNKSRHTHVFNSSGLLVFIFLMLKLLVSMPGEITDHWSETYYLLSYSDFFGARMFIGTLYTLLFKKVTYAVVFWGTIIAYTCVNALFGLMTSLALKGCSESTRFSVEICILFFLAAPYNCTSLFDWQNFIRLDTYVLLFTILSVMLVNVKGWRWLIPLLCFAATATHQGFLFLYMPALGIILLYNSCKSYKTKLFKGNVSLMAVSYAVIIASFIFFQLKENRLSLEQISELYNKLLDKTDMQLKVGPLINEYAADSTFGLDFLTATFSNSFYRGFYLKYAISTVVVMLPAFIFTSVVWKQAMAISQDRFQKFIFFMCRFAPLAVSPILLCWDWHRWVPGMLIVQFLLLLYFCRENDTTVTAALKEKTAVFKNNYPLLICLVAYLAVCAFSPIKYIVADDLQRIYVWTSENYVRCLEEGNLEYDMNSILQ